MIKTGNNMKLKNLLIVALPLIAHNYVFADQITLPNSFTSGTKAVAEEVNENFSTLALESNDQDLRITSVEEANKAVTKEVNDNFSTLALESNDQDLRITSIEAATVNAVNDSNSQDVRITALESETPLVTDQLFCTTGGESWVQFSYTLYCVQSSNPDSVRQLTFSQVVSEGWIGVSVGARSVLFNK